MKTPLRRGAKWGFKLLKDKVNEGKSALGYDVKGVAKKAGDVVFEKGEFKII